MAIGGGEVASYKGGGECHILAMGWWNTDFTLGVVNFWGGDSLGWWTSKVVNVWGGECLGWWMSGVVNVWFYTGGGERLGWWMSGVVNVWGGEGLRCWTSGVENLWFYTGGGERLRWWTSDVVNVWVVNVLQSSLSLSHHCTTIMGLSVHRKYLMQPLYQVNTFPLIAKYKSKSTLGQKQSPWQLYLHVLKVWSNLLTGRHFRNWTHWQLSILGSRLWGAIA